MYKFWAAAVASFLSVSSVTAQSISLEDFEAKVNERAQTLGGFEDYLMDPDPKRSMAALQVMLESGDETLVSMALKHGLTSPNPDVRWTALKSYLAGGPTLSVFIDAKEVPDDKAETFDQVMRRHGGTLGANKAASFNVPVGEKNEELSCIARSDFKDLCAIRVNAASVSLFVPSSHNYTDTRWIEFTLAKEGKLEGSFTTRNGGWVTPGLPASIPLIE